MHKLFEEFRLVIESFKELLITVKGMKRWMIFALSVVTVLYLFQNPLNEAVSNIIHGEPSVESGLKKNVIVVDFLEEWLCDLEADRVYVIQFHNGSRYYTKEHINKMSVSFEVMSSGVKGFADDFRDQLTSLYTKSLVEIHEGRFSYSSAQDVSDIRTRVKLEDRGVIATSVYPVFNSDGYMVAIVGVEYIKKHPTEEVILEYFNLTQWDSKLIFTKMQEEVNQLEPYL